MQCDSSGNRSAPSAFTARDRIQAPQSAGYGGNEGGRRDAGVLGGSLVVLQEWWLSHPLQGYLERSNYSTCRSSPGSSSVWREAM